jgi:hypothetical protein
MNVTRKKRMVPGDALLGRQVFERGYRLRDLKVNLFSISLLSAILLMVFYFRIQDFAFTLRHVYAKATRSRLLFIVSAGKLASLHYGNCSIELVSYV